LRPCWLCSWLRWRLPPPSPTPTASSTAAEATKTGALRVIDSEQGQPRGPQVDELVDLARHGRVGLWITEAFTVDQETAPADRHQRNLAWLSARPVIGRIPGPWRLGYSGLEGPDGFTDDTGAAADLALREIILFPQSEPSRRR
jgi:hypothetical protein